MVTLIERNANNLGTYWMSSYAVELGFDGCLKSSIGVIKSIPHQVALSEDILLKLKVVGDDACKVQKERAYSHLLKSVTL